MSNNYDDYGYDNKKRNTSSGLIRKLVIIILVFIAILLIIWLLKGCSKKNNNVIPNNNKPVEKYNYEQELLLAGKNYFSVYTSEKPVAYGECSVVELQTLINQRLVDGSKFAKCNNNTTYVKMCVLGNGTTQYTPWLRCTDKDSETEYGELKIGTISEVISDSTYTDFRFLPQEVKKGGENLGKVEEIWKDDIKYESYKTLATTNYYRYRDKLYTWELVKKNYYTRSGDKTSAKDVKEYYTSSPKSGYTKYDSKSTEAYKWYTTDSTREYYMKNGAKMPSLTAVGEYNIRDPKGIDVVRYRTRTVSGTYSPTKFYVCSENAASSHLKYTTKACKDDKEFKYTRNIVYSCASGDASESTIIDNLVNKNELCYKYSAWSSPTATKCDTSKPNICQSVTLTFYYWYKEVGGTKKYYPSGSSSASGETVYYTSAPVSNAVKDTSTKTTAYKWYKETKTVSTSYTAVAPSGYSSAKKTSQSKWSDWSSWSTKNPKVNDGRERSIEKKVKIKLRQIIGTTNDGWNNLSTEYLTEEDMILLLKSKKYSVNTLEDILNNGELNYQTQMYIRNKKESN